MATNIKNKMYRHYTTIDLDVNDREDKCE